MNLSIAIRITQFLICISLSASTLSGDRSVSGQQRSQTGTVSPQTFFRALTENPSPLPTYDELLRVVDQIPSQRTEDIDPTVKSVMSALRSSNNDVKIYAALALTVIARRSDSTTLLANQLENIGELANSDDPRLQAVFATVLSDLRPQPPAAVVPILLRFLGRHDRDTSAQGTTVFALVRVAPTDERVQRGIRSFLFRTLDDRTRIGVLNALGSPRVGDTGLVKDVIYFLGDSSPNVRLTTINAIERMGTKSVRKAEPELQRLSASDENPQVRAAAAKAVADLKKYQ